MPPILALLLCSVFVWFLLRYDRKISGVQSWAVWIPTLWMLRCATVPFDTWFDMQAYRALGASVEGGNPFDRNVLIVLIAAGVLVLMKRGFNVAAAVKDNKWLFVLLAYMFVSILWSDYTLVSLKRWFKVSGNVVMAFVVLTEVAPVKTVESILRRTVYVAVPFSLVLIKYYPELGVDFGRWSGELSWAGVTAGKNTLGLLCIIAIMVFAKDWLNQIPRAERTAIADKGALYILLAVTLWLLKGPGGAYSATSLINLLLGLPVFLMLRRFKSAGRVLTACAVAALMVIITPLFTRVVLDMTPVEVVAPLVGRNADLTGRADTIWAPLMSIALRNPVAGVGYGGFWVVPIVLDKFSINQAHNGYLDIFIELGAIGLLLFGLVIIEFVIKSSKRFDYDPHWGAFLVTILMMSLLHNYTESSFLKSTALLWAMFCVLTITARSVREPLLLTQQSTAGDDREHSVLMRTARLQSRKASKRMLESHRRPVLRRNVAPESRSSSRG